MGHSTFQASLNTQGASMRKTRCSRSTKCSLIMRMVAIETLSGGLLLRVYWRRSSSHTHCAAPARMRRSAFSITYVTLRNASSGSRSGARSLRLMMMGRPARSTPSLTYMLPLRSSSASAGSVGSQ